MRSAEQRMEMVRLQLGGRGISDLRVLAAFRRVPRESFVSAGMADLAYRDAPIPIGAGQTISQPYIVALMAEALELRPTDRVLEVGTGSGYAAAILSCLAAEVFTVERHESLAAAARERLERLGYRNVKVLHGDGTLGWPEHAPFDAIAVAAGGPGIPNALLEQLGPGGRLVIPVGPDQELQTLLRVTRDVEGKLRYERLSDVRFVPLIGAEGWQQDRGRSPAAGQGAGTSVAGAPKRRAS